MKTIVSLTLLLLFSSKSFGDEQSPLLLLQEQTISSPDTLLEEGLQTPNLEEFNGVNGVGNGGDFVRAKFIKSGHQIVDFLLNHESGQNLVDTYKINVYALAAILNTRTILPVEEKPIDNQGQPVDAIYKNGNLYLYTDSWQQFLTSDDEIYMMVFHEMLRATGHFDNDFIISRHLEITDEVELSDDPQIITDTGFVTCACSTFNNDYVLNCVDSANGNKIIENLSFGTDNKKSNFERCQAEKRKVEVHYNPQSTVVVPSYSIDSSFKAYDGRKPEKLALFRWEKVGGNKVHAIFKVEGHRGDFGIHCDNYERYITTSQGGKWSIDSDICSKLLAAILTSSEQYKVKVMLAEGVVRDFEFTF